MFTGLVIRLALFLGGEKLKNIRLFIQSKNLNMLQAFSDESYLYNYIVNNYSELPEDNIFRNPTFLNKLEEIIYFSKNNISNDDIVVWNETSRELKNKNVSFYAVILDSENGAFTIYNNLKSSIPYLQINADTDIFDAVNKIEQFNKDLEIEEEMEMWNEKFKVTMDW